MANVNAWTRINNILACNSRRNGFISWQVRGDFDLLRQDEEETEGDHDQIWEKQRKYISPLSVEGPLVPGQSEGSVSSL